MKALTEKQPRASLIAAGVKTIVTRARPVDYRGRVAIHAAAKRPASLWHDANDHPHPFVDPYVMDPCWRWDEDVDDPGSGRWSWVGPLGAVVASAVITDCVPTGSLQSSALLWPDSNVGWHQRFDGVTWVYDGELPFDDFSPGRWALLLDDIAPTSDRCPWCWGDGADPACIVRACGADTSVPAVQEVIAAARRRFAPCPVCDEKGVCDPVPARGGSGLWEWTP